MLSCAFVTAEQAQEYFDRSTDYYTKNETDYDRWHGTLAETLGLKGKLSELSKTQFDKILDGISSSGRTRAGLDCTFSAPKSVSLAMAKDEVTRNEIITCHQDAVKRLADKIEIEYLQTRSNGETFLSRNAVMAEFMHTMARPTKSNNDIPDLDLHSHLVILNETFADGKNLSCEYEKLMDKSVIKELGLVYRQELAKELQLKGYELEVTDSRQGFFELKNFDRETVLDFSNRRKEILQTAREHGLDMQTATIFSRQKKDEGMVNFDDILELTKREIFDSGKLFCRAGKTSPKLFADFSR